MTHMPNSYLEITSVPFKAVGNYDIIYQGDCIFTGPWDAVCNCSLRVMNMGMAIILELGASVPSGALPCINETHAVSVSALPKKYRPDKDVLFNGIVGGYQLLKDVSLSLRIGADGFISVGVAPNIQSFTKAPNAVGWYTCTVIYLR